MPSSSSSARTRMPSPAPPPPPPPPPPGPPPPPAAPAPPARPPPPPLPPLLNENAAAIRAIQKFKPRVTYDPQGITKTWQGNDICRDSSKYKGFICGATQKDNRLRVAGVKFNGYNFNGKHLNLGGFIEELKDLVFFHVNSNNFTGLIPSEIVKLPHFYEFDLSNNKLTGAFPTSVLGATNLTFLDLRFNSLTGKVPPQAFTLDLDVLYLNNNNFFGDIPENLGSSTALFLTFANNHFTGPIPKSIGQASNTLLEVLFLNNSLSGCLPYEIGLLKKATIFDVSVNQLTGPIPHSFGCLARMKQLNLAYNQFYGPVPESVCKLGNLFQLTLKFNYFTQVGPECRKLIARGKLDVSMNCILDLPSQRSSVQCAAFFSKKRSCPDERSYSYVPCDTNDTTSQETSDEASGLSMAPSPSYEALVDVEVEWAKADAAAMTTAWTKGRCGSNGSAWANRRCGSGDDDGMGQWCRLTVGRCGGRNGGCGLGSFDFGVFYDDRK
ncbi:hypothetical protein RJ640_030486 [Escallonia rubra]|uniref:Uncharacterized protein n=1 Tax=Escallonia rubra TaxID=112253 RepID=A0AA88QYL5_9ASTE|nr:hypothetical protein RJ640_030486 [Escallonia rubra]